MPFNHEPVPVSVRQQVIDRASYQCEYCLLDAAVSFLGFEIDHIIGRKHGGSNALDNLAYACPDCNRNKGTDIASIDWNTHDIVRFYNPRIDRWDDYFRLVNAFIEPLTSIAAVTATIFRFNEPGRILSRGRFN